MIARVATFRQLDPNALDPEAVERLRATIKSTPGYVAGFHLRNPETGKGVSFTVYESAAALQKSSQQSPWSSRGPRAAPNAPVGSST